MPIIGAQVSSAKGVYNAVENGLSIGAECIMMFGASSRQWAVKFPPEEDIKKFRELFKKSGMHSIFLHAPYLVNLGSTKALLRKKSIKLLSEHFEIGERLGAKGIIFHVGSAGEQPMKEALKLSIQGMRQVLKNVPGKSFLIMENAAGGGTKIGSTAEQMKVLLAGAGSRRVKICIDTAHAFEAGLIDYSPKSIKDFYDEWERAVGKSIVCLHANDSKTEFGSHNDRHENIGKGYLGCKAFRNLSKERRVKDLPWILEVPGFSDEGPDKKNIDILKRCVR